MSYAMKTVKKSVLYTFKITKIIAHVGQMKISKLCDIEIKLLNLKNLYQNCDNQSYLAVNQNSQHLDLIDGEFFEIDLSKMFDLDNFDHEILENIKFTSNELNIPYKQENNILKL